MTAATPGQADEPPLTLGARATQVARELRREADGIEADPYLNQHVRRADAEVRRTAAARIEMAVTEDRARPAPTVRSGIDQALRELRRMGDACAPSRAARVRAALAESERLIREAWDDVKPAPEPAEPELTEHVSIRFPADMIAAARQLAAAEGMTVSAWIRREVEREAVRREQPAPGLAAKTGPRVDWARVSEAVADRERERDEARAELAALRELLDGIGVMAADAPEDGDSFGLLEEIAMRIAAADVPDTTPAGEWPDPENPVTGRTPGGAAPDSEATELRAVIGMIWRMCQRTGETAGVSQEAVIGGEHLAARIAGLIKNSGMEPF